MGRKRRRIVLGILVSVLLSVPLIATVCLARTNLQSTYRLWTTSQVEILPVNGGEISSFAVVVDSNWARVTGEVCVTCLWQETWSGELINFGQTQTVCSDADGVIYFLVPPCSGDFFRYMTMWVTGDLASIAHRLFWYTSDVNMPAKINYYSGPSELALGETGSYVFQVLNAWGTPLSGVRVQVINGNCYTSPEVVLTNSLGYAAFSFTAPSGSVGSEVLKVQVDPWHFIQNKVSIAWKGTITTGEVASIEAVNATSYDGSLPVFDLAVEQTFGAIFVAKDSSGQPVSGVSLTSVYPSGVATTDSNGQATVTITGAVLAGSDMGQIYVTSDSTIYLDFRVVTGGTTPPPTPTGDVATITAVNPSTTEGSMPVFNATVGQTLSAIFVAKDSSGNVVSGVSLTVVYPAGTVTTDSSGQVTVTIPASSFSGWDSDRISVTSDSNVYLDFKIVYQ